MEGATRNGLGSDIGDKNRSNSRYPPRRHRHRFGLDLIALSNVQFKANFPTDYPLVIAGLQATVSGYKTIRLELSPTEKTLFVDGVEADTDTGSYDWSGITSIELGHFDGGEQPNFEIADLRINE
jgi:hypothetical protein